MAEYCAVMSRRYPLLDGLRGVASVPIVLYHCAALYYPDAAGPAARAIGSMAYTGLAGFFVLSGFLLYRPFVAARLRGRPRPSFKAYGVGRVLRLVPAFWLAMTLLTIWPGLRGVFGEHWWAYYGLGQVYLPLDERGGIGAAWSVNIEALFYLVLPVVVLLAAAGRRLGRYADAAAIVMLAIPAVVVSLFLSEPSHSFALAWAASGMALAVVHARITVEGWRLPRPLAALARRPAVGWALVLAGLVALSLVIEFDHSRPVGQGIGREALGANVLVAVTGWGMIGTAVLGAGRPGAGSKLLDSAPARYLGDVSYGFYLWHLPIIAYLVPSGTLERLPGTFAIVVALTLASSLACATASWYLVERPLLGLKPSWRNGSSSAAARKSQRTVTV